MYRVPGTWGTGMGAFLQGPAEHGCFDVPRHRREGGTLSKSWGETLLGHSGLEFLENAGSQCSWRRGLEGGEGVGTDRGHGK